MRHATMKRGRNTGHFLRLLVLFLFGSSNAFQNTGRFFLGMKNPPVAQSTISPLWDHGQALRFREMKLISTSGQKKDEEYNTGNTLRDRLRKATGLSLTAFRAAWHAATGISLTAIYATTLAASGLWIRKLTSALLYVFPAWFRYFLQPFLIAYYLPMFVIRGLTGPTQKQAKVKHTAVKEGWKEAVEFAKQAKTDGYWPVRVNANGDFELVSPPDPKTRKSEDLADALADSVEQAMEKGYKPSEPTG